MKPVAPAEPEEGQYTVVGEPVAPAVPAPTTILLDRLPLLLAAPREETDEPREEEEITHPPLPLVHRKRLTPWFWTGGGALVMLALILLGSHLLAWWTLAAPLLVVPRSQTITAQFTRFISCQGQPTSPARRCRAGRWRI